MRDKYPTAGRSTLGTVARRRLSVGVGQIRIGGGEQDDALEIAIELWAEPDKPTANQMFERLTARDDVSSVRVHRAPPERSHVVDGSFGGHSVGRWSASSWGSARTDDPGYVDAVRHVWSPGLGMSRIGRSAIFTSSSATDRSNSRRNQLRS